MTKTFRCYDKKDFLAMTLFLSMHNLVSRDQTAVYQIKVLFTDDVVLQPYGRSLAQEINLRERESLGDCTRLLFSILFCGIFEFNPEIFTFYKLYD